MESLLEGMFLTAGTVFFMLGNVVIIVLAKKFWRRQ